MRELKKSRTGPKIFSRHFWWILV
ncbi:hypothetical protein [Porphyromonas sp. COT-052 OH4946]